MSKFRERLSQPGILIADGATGTMLLRAGLPRGVAPERWNMDNPDAVRELHRGYLEAGARVILTNTFGGTRFRLEREGLAGCVEELNRTAARLAVEAAGDMALVLGDIGPSGKLLKPLGPLTYAEAVEAFAEQAAGLADGGVDAILVETMSDLKEVKAALEGVRRVSALPLLASMSFESHGHTMMGVKPSQAVKEMWDMGVDVVGANCGRTLTETLAAIIEMKNTLPEVVLLAKPNAGLPRMAQDNNPGSDSVYDVTPAIMADYALKFAEVGVKIFGGCCGSTPEHIRAVANALK